MSKKVVVVGAGIIGLCSADFLVEKGWDVTILDRDTELGPAASYGNGGLVTPSHFVPLASPGTLKLGLRMLPNKEGPFGFNGLLKPEVLAWSMKFWRAANKRQVEAASPLICQLNLRSRDLYESRYADLDCGYQRKGGLMLCQTEKGLAGEHDFAEASRRVGLDIEVLDKAGVKRLETGIEIDALGGIYFADDGHLTPPMFMAALREKLLKAGVTIRQGATVAGLKRDGGKVQAAQLDNGEEVQGDEFVLSAGAETEHLTGQRMPLLAGRGYGFTIPDPPQMPDRPAILTEARIAVTPMEDGLRFVGTMELGTPGRWAHNPNRLRGIRRSIRNAYSSLRDYALESLKVWDGYRPCSPDGVPYIGRLGSADNVTVATGHAMMGMSLGPITGELVCAAIQGEKHDLASPLLNPNRYV